MTELSVLFLGGLFCGLLAGGAAQFGRLCTFTAIEDAVTAGDLRRARSFGLALATAVLLTQLLAQFKFLDLSGNPYSQSRIELAGLIIGASLFGLGMSLVGTCGFGLLMRSGTGDMRALVSAGILGIAAAAATGGALSPIRLSISELYSVHTDTLGWPALNSMVRSYLPVDVDCLLASGLVFTLSLVVFRSRRFRQRWKLVLAGLGLGIAVTGGWIVTGILADPFGVHRLESLTFVGPLARVILLTMGETISEATFAVATVFGVVLGSFSITWVRDELRWEAFDDQREMRRHIIGATLMGFGGVLAKGCTIGQGLSASSALAASAPVAIICMVLGARLGLTYLIEGRTPFGLLGDGTRQKK
jgi:uncharacterized protein